MKKILMLLAISSILLLTLVGCATAPQNNVNDNEPTIIKMTEDLPFARYSDPVLVDDEMYICVGETKTSIGKLIDYDMKTKEYKVIFESQFNEAATQGTMANHDWVVWVDADMSGYYNNIYALDKKSNEVLKIKEYQAEEGSYMIVEPYLSGSVIAWLEFKTRDEATIVLYNLETCEFQNIGRLNEPSFYNTFVSIEGDQVLWTDSIDGKGYYCIYDINTKKTQMIEAPFPYPGYAQMSNGLIYSINFEDYHNWASHEFGCYNISTSTYSPVNDFKGSYINMFRLKGRVLAVMDKNNELKLIDAETSNLIDYTSSLKTIDSINISEDGRVVVGVEGEKYSNPTLVVIDCDN